MAHADYDCCAVCDSKMGFNSDAMPKERICSNCVANLAENGVIVHGVDELIVWIENEEREKLFSILAKVGYSPCIYGSDTDDAVEARQREPGGPNG